MGNVQHTAHGKEQPATHEGDMVENGSYISVSFISSFLADSFGLTMKILMVVAAAQQQPAIARPWLYRILTIRLGLRLVRR